MSILSILKRLAKKSEVPLASSEGKLLHYEVQDSLAKPLAYADVQLKPPSDVIVHDVFTEPEARGRGLASSLLQKIQEEHPKSSHWIASTSPEMDSVAQKTGFSMESQNGLLPEGAPAEVSYSNANIWKKVVPAVAGAGVLSGLSLTDPGEAEAIPLKVKGLFRGTMNAGQGERYILPQRSPRRDLAYRTIDNPIGAGHFGNVFNAEVNISNALNPRIHPEDILPFMEHVARIPGVNAEFRNKTLRRLLEGNWDALEDQRVQKAMMDAGFTGNIQNEPVDLIWGGFPLESVSGRRYQDVYATFERPEISIGDYVMSQGHVLDLLNRAESNDSAAIATIKDLMSPKYTMEYTLPGGKTITTDFSHQRYSPTFEALIERVAPHHNLLNPADFQSELFGAGPADQSLINEIVGTTRRFTSAKYQPIPKFIKDYPNADLVIDSFADLNPYLSLKANLPNHTKLTNYMEKLITKHIGDKQAIADILPKARDISYEFGELKPAVSTLYQIHNIHTDNQLPTTLSALKTTLDYQVSNDVKQKVLDLTLGKLSDHKLPPPENLNSEYMTWFTNSNIDKFKTLGKDIQGIDKLTAQLKDQQGKLIKTAFQKPEIVFESEPVLQEALLGNYPKLYSGIEHLESRADTKIRSFKDAVDASEKAVFEFMDQYSANKNPHKFQDFANDISTLKHDIKAIHKSVVGTNQPYYMDDTLYTHRVAINTLEEFNKLHTPNAKSYHISNFVAELYDLLSLDLRAPITDKVLSTVSKDDDAMGKVLHYINYNSDLYQKEKGTLVRTVLKHLPEDSTLPTIPEFSKLFKAYSTPATAAAAAAASTAAVAPSETEASTGKLSKFDISPIRANVPVAEGPGPLGRVEDIAASFWKGLSGKIEKSREFGPAVAMTLGHLGWEMVVNPLLEAGEVMGKVRKGLPLDEEDYGKVFNGVSALAPGIR